MPCGRQDTVRSKQRIAEDDVVDATVVLSVYEPDEDHGWDAEAGFRSRKEGGRRARATSITTAGACVPPPCPIAMSSNMTTAR